MKSIKLALLGVFVEIAQGATLPNVPATFGSSPQPFTLNVNKTFIEEVRQKVQNARAPMPLDGLNPPDADGVPFQEYRDTQDFWASKFSWSDTQASINNRFKQFTTTVRSPSSNFTSPVPLHFVHHRSPRADALPLLFIHGWPGSFLEVGKIIDRLTNPPNASVPAFHVVAPSIPGFGFSPAPERPGYGPAEAAHSFNSLMLQLNYTKYVIQGGDYGGVILRWQGAMFPDNVVSVLSNFWVIPPNANDLARYRNNRTTPDETTYISRLNNFNLHQSGYRFVQQNVPLSLAYALTDSPLGYAMWIYSLMREGVTPGYKWSAQDIIVFSLMYTIQGPYAGMRFYLENAREGTFSGFTFGTAPNVTQPLAISEFPYDIWFGLPLDWARRGGNVQARYVHNRGGHFAAFEVPGLLTNDIWRWFGGLDRSLFN